MTARPSSRASRITTLLLAMTIACAGSGIVLDARVMALVARGLAAPQSELDRADQVATVLLLLSLAVTGAAFIACIVWIVLVRPRKRAGLFVGLGAVAVPLANPVAPFLIRGMEQSLPYGIAARGLGIIAALTVLILVRRGSSPRG
ncbi:MAG: hypothetical protein KF678_05015 [Phycisphaeraceae bacterium]|nr:hypothetical protein [Phycisphaeraceae bacterium]